MRARLLFPLAVLTLLVVPAGACAAVAHVVAPGESLYSVAAADGLTVAQLAAANGLASGSQLIAGRTLQIPPQTGGASHGAIVGSTVGDGDGDTDDIGSGGTVRAVVTSTVGDGDGDSDDIGSGGTTRTVVASATAASTGSGDYVVQPGDTLSAIAVRAGTTVIALAAANGIDLAAPLRAGSVLRLSRAVSLPSTASSQPVGTAAEGSAGA